MHSRADENQTAVTHGGCGEGNSRAHPSNWLPDSRCRHGQRSSGSSVVNEHGQCSQGPSELMWSCASEWVWPCANEHGCGCGYDSEWV